MQQHQQRRRSIHLVLLTWELPGYTRVDSKAEEETDTKYTKQSEKVQRKMNRTGRTHL